MASMLIWLPVVVGSLAVMAIAAGGRAVYLHMLAAAVVALTLAYVALRENRQATARGTSEAGIAALNARFMGIVWTWGALLMLITYGVVGVVWKEWLHFFLALVVAAGLSLGFAVLLDRDAAAKNGDKTLVNLARTLAKVQLVGMVIVMLGLLIDGKMWRFLNPRHGDWAANNIFFFGALAIACISLVALRTQSPSDTGKA